MALQAMQEKKALSSRGRGHHPLQCSCLENPTDRGAWWAAIYAVAQSRTRLKQLSSSTGTLGVPLKEPGMSGNFSMSHEGCHPFLYHCCFLGLVRS